MNSKNFTLCFVFLALAAPTAAPAAALMNLRLLIELIHTNHIVQMY